MPVRDLDLIEHRRRAFGESRTADRRFGNTIRADSGFAAEREARIRAMQAEVSKVELPEHGIEPRRGIQRPIVFLTLITAGATPACLIEPSVTCASVLLGVETCSVCEAIRERRPIKGHVIRYLDQIEQCGEAADGLFRFSGSHEPDLSYQELLRLTLADADAPGRAPSN